MKTPFLIDVPKDRLSNKEKISLFKKINQVESISGGKGWEWICAHMPTARSFGYGIKPEDDLAECYAKAGRLLEENGTVQYGITEKEAIQNLIKEHQKYGPELRFPFSL